MHLLPTTTHTCTVEWTPQTQHRTRHLHMDHVLERNVFFRCHCSRQLRNRSDTLLLQLARSPGASATDQPHAVRLHTLCACRYVDNLLTLETSASATLVRLWHGKHQRCARRLGLHSLQEVKSVQHIHNVTSFDDASILALDYLEQQKAVARVLENLGGHSLRCQAAQFREIERVDRRKGVYSLGVIRTSRQERR